jgi:hypothetical protein
LRLQPRELAVEYYFGDQYWKLPNVAAEELEEGYDGPALRMLACTTDPIKAEMNQIQIDTAVGTGKTIEACRGIKGCSQVAMAGA